MKAETFSRAKAVFGERKLVEIAILITNYMGTAALLCAFDMQLQPAKSRGCRSPEDRRTRRYCGTFSCEAAFKDHTCTT